MSKSKCMQSTHTHAHSREDHMPFEKNGQLKYAPDTPNERNVFWFCVHVRNTVQVLRLYWFHKTVCELPVLCFHEMKLRLFSCYRTFARFSLLHIYRLKPYGTLTLYHMIMIRSVESIFRVLWLYFRHAIWFPLQFRSFLHRFSNFQRYVQTIGQ